MIREYDWVGPTSTCRHGGASGTRRAIAWVIAVGALGALGLGALGCGGGSTENPPADGAPQGDTGAGDADARTVDPSLSFFITSAGNGAAAGDYGGLAGADARCQALAEAVGAGARTWRAYLSTDDIGVGEVVDARDRIGAGPWFNVEGTLVADDVDDLHARGVEPALMLDENGATAPRTEHDLLTGSGSDGRLRFRDTGGNATCSNWTSNDNADFGWVGHTDGDPSIWNTAHETRCSEFSMNNNNGTGRLMCFAAD